MTELNGELMLGFLLWSAFCLSMLVATRFRENKWKRAAKAMECHADELQKEVNALRWERQLKRISDAKK